MSSLKRDARDPRTVSRHLLAVCELLFPQLVPGVVAHLNRRATSVALCAPVPKQILEASALAKAMLFELAIAGGEQLLSGSKDIDWATCLATAVARQRQHFDAKIPESLNDQDKIAAARVAHNLAIMLGHLNPEGLAIARSPAVPGYQWIASGVGDFAIGNLLIEVKCSSRPFTTADFRQVAMYWLLSYAAAIGQGRLEWTHAVLLNPRLNKMVQVSFDELIALVSAGRSKIEILETLEALVGDEASRLVGS